MSTVHMEVFRADLGDVEDPMLYAAEPLVKWEESEAGKFIKANACFPPIFHMVPDSYYGTTVVVNATLRAKDATYYKLKFYDQAKRG